MNKLRAMSKNGGRNWRLLVKILAIGKKKKKLGAIVEKTQR